MNKIKETIKMWSTFKKIQLKLISQGILFDGKNYLQVFGYSVDLQFLICFETE